MLYKVVIQKTVLNKPRPKEADRRVNRRVIVVESVTAEGAKKKVLADAEMMGPDHIGEIVAVEGPMRFAVLCA